MPEITVTETQQETLSTIQADLEAAYVDTYGHVRTTDVVQYLLDTYTPPERRDGTAAHERIATADFQALQAIATDVEGVPGSGIDTETMRGELLSTLGVAEFAGRLAEVDDGETADAAAADEENAGDGTTEDDAATAADGTADGAADAASDGDTDADSGSAGGVGSADSGDGPGSILSAANQLLDDHDDKWRDGGSDEPYEVDLPDGTTEKVRTKDDVRGLLFKHY